MAIVTKDSLDKELKDKIAKEKKEQELEYQREAERRKPLEDARIEIIKLILTFDKGLKIDDDKYPKNMFLNDKPIGHLSGVHGNWESKYDNDGYPYDQEFLGYSIKCDIDNKHGNWANSVYMSESTCYNIESFVNEVLKSIHEEYFIKK